MDDQKYLRLLDDRILYHGLLGRSMKVRRLGAISIYAAPSGVLRIRSMRGQWESREIVAVPAFQAHQIECEAPSIINVLVETERLQGGEVERLLAEVNCPSTRKQYLARIRTAASRLSDGVGNQAQTAGDFDRSVFGRELARLMLDPRVEATLNRLAVEDVEQPYSASELASEVNLSTSRFLHLFKDETGISFRNYRMWRRARNFLGFANHESSLTDVALSLGYPDSSHFSHSIRRIFGLQPRSIRYGSQDLRIDNLAQTNIAVYA